MRIVHGAGASPFVRKVRVVLAEKGLEYELKPLIPFNVSAEYRKISPLGKIPTYEEDGRIVNDSSVICAYLERAHPEPALYPSDPYEYARALWFEEFGDGGLAPVIGGKVFFPKIIAPIFFKQPVDQATIDKAFAEDIPPLFDYLESQLEAREAIAGTRFSIGDIGIATQFVNFRHAGYEVDAKRWPKLARYIGHLLDRPSFKALYEEERGFFAAAR